MEKFSEYQADTDFLAWGIKIAHYEILKLRKNQRRIQERLSKETLRVLAREAQAAIHLLDDRKDALRVCVKKLPPRDLRLIRMRYAQDVSVQVIAQRLQRSAQVVYKHLARIHDILIDCVNQTLARQGLL